MKRPGLFLIIAVLVLTTAPVDGTVSKPPDGPPIGTAAPAFSLPDLGGRQVNRDQFRGRILVLNFWAFWCDTWKAELPHLKELAADQDRDNFRLLAVSVDGTRLDEYWRSREGETPFPVLLDPGSRISGAYNVHHVPTVVIIDAKGRVRYVKVGYPGNQALLSQIRKIRNEKG